MSNEEIFSGFSEEQQEEYAQQARERWDPELVDRSMKLWKSYSPEKKQQVLDEGKVGLEKIWEISEAIADLDAPVFILMNRISELRLEVEAFRLAATQAQTDGQQSTNGRAASSNEDTTRTMKENSYQ